MSWRRLTRADLPQLDEILHAHHDQTMFIAVNLASDGFETEAPRAMRVWWDGVNAFGLSNAGMGFPIGPARPDWSAAGAALRGQSLRGIIGPSAWVAGVAEAFGLAHCPCQHLAQEPHFALNLDDLIVPPRGALRLSPITAAQRATAIAWRAAYVIETLGTPARDAPAQAAREIDDYIARDSHRILWDGATPVAMTGFNAQLPARVQIGGVYTPPDLRGRGYARSAVALHLEEIRHEGARRAVLTAANAPAVRAYRAIGFQQIGLFTFHIFAQAQQIG